MQRTMMMLAFALTLTVGAHANLVTNGSFENTNNTFVPDANHVDILNSGSTLIPGWTTTNSVPLAWLQNGNPYGISAQDGQCFLDLTGYADSGTYGGVTQSFATTPGTNYTVTFELGYGGASRAFSGPVSVRASAAGSSQTFTSASGDPNPALWNLETFNFTATSGTTQLSLVGVSTAGGEYIGLDNVNVQLSATASIPEPGTWGLLVCGIALLGCAKRRVASR
jgi:hypothetical protein